MARSESTDPAADFSLALASALPTLPPASIEQLVGVLHTAGVDTISEMRLYGTLELIVRAPRCAAAVQRLVTIHTSGCRTPPLASFRS